jgi:predicted molibdopterin-dependent oxidoreductase YjgC
VRLKPRFNGAVNQWWICDEGRYGFGDVDAPTRLERPELRSDGTSRPMTWEEAVAALADGLRTAGPEGVGVLLSPRMANEDLWLARRLFADTLGVRHLDFRVPPKTPGSVDDLLRLGDKAPNRRGAELLGCATAGAADGRHVLEAARAGHLRLLWVFDHDLLASGWPAAEVEEALGRVEGVVFQGANANATSARAHVVLPSAAYVEREGTWTNAAGRVQRFWRAVPALGEARPDWEILAAVAQALGHDWRPVRAEHLFRELTAATPAFEGLTYRALGDQGLAVAGATPGAEGP